MQTRIYTQVKGTSIRQIWSWKTIERAYTYMVKHPGQNQVSDIVEVNWLLYEL